MARITAVFYWEKTINARIFALYIKPGESLSKGNMRGLRTNRYTFVLAKSAKKGITKTILFDNREDPYQLKNVASEHPELIKSFTNILTKRLHEIGGPVGLVLT